MVSLMDEYGKDVERIGKLEGEFDRLNEELDELVLREVWVGLDGGGSRWGVLGGLVNHDRQITGLGVVTL